MLDIVVAAAAAAAAAIDVPLRDARIRARTFCAAWANDHRREGGSEGVRSGMTSVLVCMARNNTSRKGVSLSDAFASSCASRVLLPVKRMRMRVWFVFCVCAQKVRVSFGGVCGAAAAGVVCVTGFSWVWYVHVICCFPEKKKKNNCARKYANACAFVRACARRIPAYM